MAACLGLGVMAVSDLDEFLAEQLQDAVTRAAFDDAGDRARLLRELTVHSQQRALSVEEIAERMECTVDDVHAYERGEVDPHWSFVQRYARAVGVRLSVEIEETG